jgi:hypothetical protein
MIHPIPPTHPEMIRRAFRVADRDGEAALNGLLYASGALMMSAVLLVATAPAMLAVVLATIPWLALAIGIWLWIQPAWYGEGIADQQHRLLLERARALAVDLLLDDAAPGDDRRLAAAYLSEDLRGEARSHAAEQLLQTPLHRIGS